jgi:prophage regulatory protein
MTNDPHSPRLISAHEVSHKTSLSRTTLWRLIQEDQFPAPVRLSANRVGWSEKAVEAWIANKLAGAVAPPGKVSVQ